MTLLVSMVMTVAVAKPKEVTALTITPPAEGGLCPGERFPLEVVATESSGKERKVKVGKGDYEATWELGAVESRDAAIVMPLDPREAWGKEGRVTVTSVADSRVRAEISAPLRFDCSVQVDLSGGPGEPGQKGEDGIDTQQNGTDGIAGENGGGGEDGPEVHVRVVMVEEPRTQAPVLQVEIQKLGEDGVRYAAISPTGGELVVMANGGRGGQGGTGGQGGDGEAPNPNGTGGGQSGAGGEGGAGGTGGRGGIVVVFVDPSAEGRTRAVIVENGGGEGGSPGLGGGMGVGGQASSTRPGSPGNPGRRGPDGPAPEVHGAPVGPLW